MKFKFLTDKDYHFIFSQAPRLCVDLLIKTKQGILLSKRLIEPYKGFWHLPGGRVYFREPIENALQRVAKAEIGAPVEIQKLVGFSEFLRETQNKKNRHSVSLVFLVRPQKKYFSGGWQAEKFAFFKSTQKNINPVHGKFLKAHKFLK
jgi:ADP-ribose pyrophosphatase YjhB (NUDIX family)